MGVRLPPEYQEVEYLRGNGTQYIDLQYIPSCDETFLLDFWIVSRTADGNFFCLFGSRKDVNVTATDIENCWIGLTAGGVVLVRFGTVNPNETFVLPLGYKKLKVDLSSRYVEINNARRDFSGGRISTNRSIFLGMINGYRLTSGGTICFKEFQIVRNNNTIRDYVPCYRKSDSKPGMYDLVSGEFLVNQGTGEFLVGPDVIDSISPLMVAWRRAMMREPMLPSLYQKVEYIKWPKTTSVNPRIDTDIYPNSTTIVEMSFMNTSNIGANVIFGSADVSSGTYAFILGRTGWARVGKTQKNIDLPSFNDVQYINAYQHIILSQAEAVLNGVTYVNENEPLSQSINNCLCIGRRRQAGTYLQGSTAGLQLYDCKIWHNNSLAHDFIPCYRKLDNKPGLYDRVSKTFFINNGDGEFELPT